MLETVFTLQLTRSIVLQAGIDYISPANFENIILLPFCERAVIPIGTVCMLMLAETMVSETCINCISPFNVECYLISSL